MVSAVMLLCPISPFPSGALLPSQMAFDPAQPPFLQPTAVSFPLKWDQQWWPRKEVIYLLSQLFEFCMHRYSCVFYREHLEEEEYYNNYLQRILLRLLLHLWQQHLKGSGSDRDVTQQKENAISSGVSSIPPVTIHCDFSLLTVYYFAILILQ